MQKTSKRMLKTEKQQHLFSYSRTEPNVTQLPVLNQGSKFKIRTYSLRTQWSPQIVATMPSWMPPPPSFRWKSTIKKRSTSTPSYSYMRKWSDLKSRFATHVRSLFPFASSFFSCLHVSQSSSLQFSPSPLPVRLLPTGVLFTSTLTSAKASREWQTLFFLSFDFKSRYYFGEQMVQHSRFPRPDTNLYLCGAK